MPQAKKKFVVTQPSCSLGKRGDIVEIEGELTARQAKWVTEHNEKETKLVVNPEKETKLVVNPEKETKLDVNPEKKDKK